MASIKLILRTHQADQTGHSPLYIRIIKDRKTKFITAGVKLKENEWDEVKQKAKKITKQIVERQGKLVQLSKF